MLKSLDGTTVFRHQQILRVIKLELDGSFLLFEMKSKKPASASPAGFFFYDVLSAFTSSKAFRSSSGSTPAVSSSKTASILVMLSLRSVASNPATNGWVWPVLVASAFTEVKALDSYSFIKRSLSFISIYLFQPNCLPQLAYLNVVYR